MECLIKKNYDNWEWFMQRLRNAIRTPPGSVIHTDSNKNKGFQSAISDVFGEHVEYRECFRHLLLNFNKKFRGGIFDSYMWHAAWTYVRHKYDVIAQACPATFEHLETYHPHIWTRSKFSPTSKIEYVCNNLTESFNSWIKGIKELPLVDLANKLRQMIMKQMSKRKVVANSLTENILPSVVRALNAKSRGLNYTIIRSGDHGAEVTTFDKKTKKELTFGVCLDKNKCTCRQWQISGKPCLHAITFICSIRGAKIEDYADECFSVAKFKMAYETSITAIGDKSQWPKVDPGFKMLPPKLGRSAGRPKTTRIPNSGEGSSKKGRKQCARCHEFGHHAKGCKAPKFDPGCMVPPPQPPKAKKRYLYLEFILLIHHFLLLTACMISLFFK